MQWDATPNAGFTTGKPWLMVNPNYPQINAARQMQDEDSVWNYYRALMALRKAHPVMVYGSWTEYEPQREDVYLYTRTLDSERWLVALNLTGAPTKVAVPAGVQPPLTRVLGNEKDLLYRNGELTLRPWEAVIAAY